MSQVGHLPYHSHWWKSPPRWPTEVANRVWQPSATRGREELLKRLLETGEAENLPTTRRCLIPLNQVFFVFRSNSEGNTWNEVCDLTEKLLKRFTKYGWCFPLPDRVHSSLQSVKMGVLWFQEQRALGGVLKELPITLILPGLNSSVGKESTCNAGGLGSFPGLGRSPGEGNGNPLQYSGLENPMDRGAW